MLKHNEIKKGKIIVLNNDPCEVTEHSHVVKGRGRSVMQTKLRNLRTGTTLQKTFHGREEAEEAEIEKMSATFVYTHRGKYVFHEKDNPAKRLTLKEEQVGEKKDYLIEESLVSLIFFKEEIIGISLPVKMEFQIKEAPPGVRGNTAEGGTKTAVMETGKEIEVPLFVEAGEKIEVNTETGKYARRVD